MQALLLVLAAILPPSFDSRVPDPVLRATGQELLRLSTQEPGLEALLERLKTEDAAARGQAREELHRRGAEAVAGALRALEASAPDVAGRVEELVRALGSRAWKERDRAARDLAALGRHAKPFLEPHGAAKDAEVAWRVRSVLAEIGDRAVRDEMLEDVRDIALCEFLGEAGDAKATAALLRVAASPASERRPELRAAAAGALGRLRAHLDPAQADATAERVLVLFEKAPGPQAKALLLKVLADLRSPACVRPLAALLSNRSEKNLNLKRAALAALAATGDERGLRAVIDALASDEPYVREGAAAVLGGAGVELAGFDPRADPREDRKAVLQARAWWSKKFRKSWDE